MLEGISLDLAIESFCFLFLFSLVRLMENNRKMRELYELYLELGHEVFEEKIKKLMELYLHTLHDCNVTSMSSLNSFDANDMQSHKLGDAMFDEDDIFSPPSFDENICYDDTLTSIYDDYNDECDIFNAPTIEEEIYYDYNMPPIYDDYCDETYAIKNTILQVDHDKNDLYDSYFVEFAPTIINEKDFAYVESNIFLCLWIMIRKFYVILILLSLLVIPLKIIMRGEHMLIDISIISSSLSLY